MLLKVFSERRNRIMKASLSAGCIIPWAGHKHGFHLSASSQQMHDGQLPHTPAALPLRTASSGAVSRSKPFLPGTACQEIRKVTASSMMVRAFKPIIFVSLGRLHSKSGPDRISSEILFQQKTIAKNNRKEVYCCS